MILRRYGTKYLSVTPNFDSRAMTEVGFTRDGAVSLSVEEFEERYVRQEAHELTASADGGVQSEVEDAVLARLSEQLGQLGTGLADGQILVIESTTGVDHPKTRGKQTTTVVEGENRMVFEYTIDPPLRVAIHGSR